MRIGLMATTALVVAVGFASAATARNSTEVEPLSRRAPLGVALQPSPNGPQVIQVAPNSTAQQSGIEVGDVITALNSVPTPDNQSLVSAASTLRDGDRAVISLKRDNKPMQVTGRAIARPLEAFTNADVSYGTVGLGEGRLRDILVTPKAPLPLAPVVFLIQGYGCGSVEGNPSFAYHLLAKELADRGIATYRIEKAGMGDSINPATCIKTDFDEEMRGFRAGYDALVKTRGVSPDRIIIFGHSMGGVQAPLLAAQGPAPRGIAVYGTVVRNWQDYTQHIFAFQSFLSADSDPAEGERAARLLRALNQRMFNEDVSLAKIAADSLEHAQLLREAWDWDGNDQILGRNIEYWRGVGRQDLVAAWRDSKAPVLSLYGEADFAAVDATDHKLIVDIINHYRPNTARFVQIPQTGHGFDVQAGREEVRQANKAGQPISRAPFNPQIAEELSNWIKALPTG